MSLYVIASAMSAAPTGSKIAIAASQEYFMNCPAALLWVINKKDNTEDDHDHSNRNCGRPAAAALTITTCEPLFFRVAAHTIFQLTCSIALTVYSFSSSP